MTENAPRARLKPRLKTEEFDFRLPREKIASRPARPRDSSRLLEVKTELRDHLFRDLPSLLKPGDILVFNDTRVIPAQLSGRRRHRGGEAKIAVTLHKRTGAASWLAFARPAKKLRAGDEIVFSAAFRATFSAPLHATVAEKGEGGEVTLAFDREGDHLDAALRQFGAMPLPPYLQSLRAIDEADNEDYQTMFAAHDGAVAAPTAGLHFTPKLMDALAARHIRHATLTLHVGAGTFLPVKTAYVDDHPMHAEFGEITGDAARAVNAAREAGGRVVAVGTTSLRLLESATGATTDQQGRVQPFSGETDIFITPGARFRAVDLLLTNFHLPRSTLFMLVCAFSGTTVMKAAYEHAIGTGYRFYSYGDGCLLHPQKET